MKKFNNLIIDLILVFMLYRFGTRLYDKVLQGTYDYTFYIVIAAVLLLVGSLSGRIFVRIQKIKQEHQQG